MKEMNAQRFFDLAMKTIARQSTEAERAELDAMLAQQPGLKAEFEQLQADSKLACEVAPLAAAMESAQPEFPAYARERLQTKVRQTLGKTEAGKAPKSVPWFRWLALASGVAAIAMLLLSTMFTERPPVIQLALLDATGATRGGTNEDARQLSEVWKDAELQQFSRAEEAAAWRQRWPEQGNSRLVKIIYDRAAAEIQVFGKWRGKEFSKVIVVDKSLADALRQAQEFIRQQTAP